MTDVAIHARSSSAVTIYAPSHRLIDLAPNEVRPGYLPVTLRAINLCAHVRFMREEDISLTFKPVDARPQWLLAALVEGRELSDLRAVRLFTLMAGHAGFRIRYRRVRRFVRVLVTEDAVKLRAFLLRDVLPVIECYGLARRFGLA